MASSRLRASAQMVVPPVSSDEEFEFHEPATGAVVPPRNSLPTSSNGSKSHGRPSTSNSHRPTTAGAWSTQTPSQPRAGPNGGQRGSVNGNGRRSPDGKARRQSTGNAGERNRSENAGGNALDGRAKRAPSVISLSDSSDESARVTTATRQALVANGGRRHDDASSANGQVSKARRSSSNNNNGARGSQRTASSEDELLMGTSTTRRPSQPSKRPRQSSSTDSARRTNGVDTATTAAKRTSGPSGDAQQATASATGSNGLSGSTKAHSAHSTQERSGAPKLTARGGAEKRRASDATSRAVHSASQVEAPPRAGPSQQVPIASARRKSTPSTTPSAVPTGSSASPTFRVPAAWRKALGASSPNGAAFGGRPPSSTDKNLASSVSPVRVDASSSVQIIKPKSIYPGSPRTADDHLGDDAATRQEARQRATASASNPDQQGSVSAPRDDEHQPAEDGQLPLNGRRDLHNLQSGAASPPAASTTTYGSDVEIVSEKPAAATAVAAEHKAPAPRGFAGSDSSRSPTRRPESQPESSRSPTPVPPSRQNLGFAGSSTPEAEEPSGQLDDRDGLLADGEDNTDEAGGRPLGRQYSRVVPDSEDEGSGPSVRAAFPSPWTGRQTGLLSGTTPSRPAPHRSHQVARAMSGGFAARKSTSLGRPKPATPAAVQRGGHALQGSPAPAPDHSASSSAAVDAPSPTQPAPPSRPATEQQARPIQPAPRSGVARKSTVVSRPPTADVQPPQPPTAPSSKRTAEGPASEDASDTASRAKRPRRAAAAAADAANEQAASKGRRRRKSGGAATSPAAQVLGSIAIAGDDADKPASAKLRAADEAELRMRVEEFVRRQQIEQPWNRVIAGPSYDRLDEFSTEIQDAVNRREQRFAELHPSERPIRTGYKELFEQMILEANSKEYPPPAPDEPDYRPKIRVCGPRDAPDEAWSSPPFEFIYTNRVVYDADIVPIQAPGCECIGNCGDPANRKTCACLQRQIAASKSRVGGGKRSDRQDFAYDRDSCLFEDALGWQDPIIECNSECGCGPKCINRVVGKRKGISVDIFWTGIAGWGVRLPPDYEGDLINGSYLSSRVKRGAPLAIYAGELMRSPEAYTRDDLIYSYIERNYIYDLDHWTIGEEIEARAPPAVKKQLAIASPDASHKSTHTPKAKVKDEGSEIAAPEQVDDEVFSSFYSIDAYNFGNWTRFANHVCDGFNVVPRPVYVDEGDVTRPLWVYFASRDILPGEEINISYFGESEPNPQDFGMTDAEWIAAANKQRDEAPPAHRCYCNKRLCRGRMFNIPGEMFWDKRDGGK